MKVVVPVPAATVTLVRDGERWLIDGMGEAHSVSIYHARGGRLISAGNAATPVGVSMRSPCLRLKLMLENSG